jgi:hypothetical protein
VFSPDETLWVSQHPDLIGDPRLGTDHQQRFLPTRFTIAGAALDARGFSCHGLACPHCHLVVPRGLYEMEPAFMSILGAPASGKSYFLASMTWQLRQVLPKYFALSFADADPVFNHRLHEYESLHFLNPDQETPVAIEKTELQGDLYDTVLFGDQAVNYPRPFLFSMAPLENHPHFTNYARLARAFCLYDNAGEHFMPGQDTALSPVTRHLALSRALIFVFDPTQDMRFRDACKGKSSDPQMAARAERLVRERPVRQETILLEAAQRIRRYSGLGQNEKHSRPLIVAVSKFDCWASLLGNPQLELPWIQGANGLCAVDTIRIERISQEIRGLLWKLAPELVAAAESFAEQVIYIPSSATGCSPEVDPVTGQFKIRPKNLRPIWVETPLLYAMSKWMQGLIPFVRPKANGSSSGAPAHGPPPLRTEDIANGNSTSSHHRPPGAKTPS